MSFRGNLIKKFYIYMTFPPFKFSLLFFHFITHIKAHKKITFFTLLHISAHEKSPHYTHQQHTKNTFFTLLQTSTH